MPLTSIEYAHGGESALADTGRNFGLSGAALKWIAMITMLIDHIGAVVMEYGLYYQGGAETFRRLLDSGNGQWLYTFQRLMRMVGRPSFLLYSFPSGRRIFSYKTAENAMHFRCFYLP